MEECTLGDLIECYDAKSEKVDAMVESGELEKLHQEFATVENDYTAAHKKMMDTIERT